MTPPQFLAPEHAEFAFGTKPHGWSGFVVVDFHGVEAISEPFRYVITLLRRASDAIALESLLDADATLAISARNERGYYVRHGIVEEAEELDRTSEMVLYQVVLSPTFSRARYRQRCRTFLEQTLQEIITSVLRNESTRHPNGFKGLERQDTSNQPELLASPIGAVDPSATFSLRIDDNATKERLEDRQLRAYLVQYNESDFDFVSRLLEEEGISYFFEHHAGGSTMWLCDRPGRQSYFEERQRPQPVRFQSHMRGFGPGDVQVVDAFYDRRRMRSRAVTMRDWSWTRSHLVLESPAIGNSGEEDQDGHFEFPGRDHSRETRPCEQPATVRLERFEVERNLSHGHANLRGLMAGRRIAMTEHPGPEEGYLVTRVETVAVQSALQGTALDQLPFGFEGRTPRAEPQYQSRFDALRGDVRFRPAMRTRKPRIDGIQSAIVTHEQGDRNPPPEINSDSWGRVRVRFHWDQRNDQRPSSKWLRVSQYWAGQGFGALYTPRVGQEVLIAYMEGDPDQPTVVGRVYNATNPLPIHDYDQHLEQSTVRSQSTPNASGHNEILFDDRAHHECLRIHAQRDMRETVLRNHNVNVHGAESISVGGDQSTTVGGNQTNTVEKDHTNHTKGNHHHNVDLDHNDYVIGNIECIGGGFHRDYAAANREIRATNFYVETGPNQDGTAGDIQLKSATAAFWQVEQFEIHVGSAFMRMLPGLIELNTGGGARILLVGADASVETASRIGLLTEGQIEVACNGDMRLSSGANMTATATLIRLNP